MGVYSAHFGTLKGAWMEPLLTWEMVNIKTLVSPIRRELTRQHPQKQAEYSEVQPCAENQMCFKHLPSPTCGLKTRLQWSLAGV